jgi:hypothetical protein
MHGVLLRFKNGVSKLLSLRRPCASELASSEGGPRGGSFDTPFLKRILAAPRIRQKREEGIPRCGGGGAAMPTTAPTTTACAELCHLGAKPAVPPAFGSLGLWPLIGCWLCHCNCLIFDYRLCTANSSPQAGGTGWRPQRPEAEGGGGRRSLQARIWLLLKKSPRQSPWGPGGTMCHACVARPGLLQKSHRAQRAHRHWAIPARPASWLSGPLSGGEGGGCRAVSPPPLNVCVLPDLKNANASSTPKKKMLTREEGFRCWKY